MGAGASHPAQTAATNGAAAANAQWAQRVVGFSSQHDGLGSAAVQACGRPKVFPAYGDKQGAWAPGANSGSSWIELEFARAVYMCGIEIYETFNPGAVVRVMVLSPQGVWESAWRGDPAQMTLPARSRVFSPPIKPPPYAVNAVRLELDTAASAGWSKIDAVRLVAHPWGGDHVAWSEFQQASAPVQSSSSSSGRAVLGDVSNGRQLGPTTRPCTATRVSYSLSASETKLRTRVEELESALANLRVEKASARGFKKEQRKDQPDCVICWDHSASMVMVPCGHMCMCRGCAGSWCKSHTKPADARCPLCRVPTTHTQHVFLAAAS